MPDDRVAFRNALALQGVYHLYCLLEQVASDLVGPVIFVNRRVARPRLLCFQDQRVAVWSRLDADGCNWFGWAAVCQRVSMRRKCFMHAGTTRCSRGITIRLKLIAGGVSARAKIGIQRPVG